MVETGVGEGIGCTDDDYHAAGAEIVGAAADVFAKAEMVVKVKEPQPAEVARLREGQILFTYLHLAADLAQTKGLSTSGAIALVRSEEPRVGNARVRQRRCRWST